VTQPTLEPDAQWRNDRRQAKVRKRLGPVVYAALAIGVVIFIRAAVIVTDALWPPAGPAHSVRYLGVYEPDAPGSYAGVDQFAQAIDRQPNLVLYYSHWLEPFNVHFATEAAKHGAVTFVQIAPTNVSLASIASGRYDGYLRSYALAVKAFDARVILSFGHEMNGYWYSWGYGHTSPAVFVAAWQHVVTLFRDEGAQNVTWLWTVNIVGLPNRTPDPAPWWPGRSYVDWVGIDGYYRSPDELFSSVFGSTIADVRELTSDPIIIAETAAQVSDGQAAKIADLFAGVSTYGLLGFVWFDQDDYSRSPAGQIQRWRLSSPEALAAFGRDAKAFMEPLSGSAALQKLHLSSMSSSSSP
jgi:hypothetical protein